MKPTKRIVLAGGSGFLGGMLSRYFGERGYEVVVLTRKPRADVAGEVQWDGETLGPWVEALNGAEAVINLAGRSVDCRYHARNRKLIMDSRVKSTRVLGEAIRSCPRPPRVWMNSSTATIYRHTFETAWDETGVVGATREAKDAFSVEVAKAWEAAFNEQSTPTTRKILLRSSMVLGAGGSVFRTLRRLTLCGLGGRMGHGKQFVSWIHEHDFCAAIEWLLHHDEVSGIVNIAAPEPLPNAEMMKQLRAKCGLPIGLPATAWMLELGAFILRTESELIIKSRRVVPGRLRDAGFKFRYQTFPEALEDLWVRSKGL